MLCFLYFLGNNGLNVTQSLKGQTYMKFWRVPLEFHRTFCPITHCMHFTNITYQAIHPDTPCPTFANNVSWAFISTKTFLTLLKCHLFLGIPNNNKLGLVNTMAWRQIGVMVAYHLCTVTYFWTKWPPFRRCHFQKPFHEGKVSYIDLNFTVCS